MEFRNVRAEELQGSADIPGLKDWLRSVGATDAAILLMAPPGTGKSAAVGHLAHRLGRDVLLCNLMELFDNHDPSRQLKGLLRLCEVQKHSVIYLDKLDKALVRWEREPHGIGLAQVLEEWIPSAKRRLLEDECTVVFTGRDPSIVSESLVRQFDKVLCPETA
jgi:hypothetical protein